MLLYYPVQPLKISTLFLANDGQPGSVCHKSTESDQDIGDVTLHKYTVFVEMLCFL